MGNELITVEYAGPASRQVGYLPWYDVRAWWTVQDENSERKVKLAARKELKRHIQADHVEFVHMDMDTYNSPHINAMVTFRVLTAAQFAQRAERRAMVVHTCALCGSTDPCNYLRMSDNSEQGVCYGCLRGPALVNGTYQTIAWIGTNGRLQV